MNQETNTHETMNRQLHEAMGRGCWHVWQNDAWSANGRDAGPYEKVCEASNRCIYCPTLRDVNRGSGWFVPIEVPRYTESLDAVEPVEKFVIEKVGQFKWFGCLEEAVRESLGRKPREFELICSTAEQRARACYAALGLEKEK